MMNSSNIDDNNIDNYKNIINKQQFIINEITSKCKDYRCDNSKLTNDNESLKLSLSLLQSKYDKLNDINNNNDIVISDLSSKLLLLEQKVSYYHNYYNYNYNHHYNHY